MMHRLLMTLTLAATLLLALFPGIASACSCLAPSEDGMDEWFAEQAFIFEGEAIATSPLPADHPSASGYFGERSNLVTFRVDRVIKGEPVSEVQMLSVEGGSAACQMSFDVGESGIYAPSLIEGTRTYRTSLCTQIQARSYGVGKIINQLDE